MCIIIDANIAALVFSPSNDFKPLIDWLEREGKMVIGGRLSEEIDQIHTVRRFVRALLQAGKARVIPSGVVEQETSSIAGACESNDPHIIALARVGGARILCSHDKTLHRDFGNPALISNPQGHIYQNAGHAHLLRKYGHTPACGQSGHSVTRTRKKA